MTTNLPTIPRVRDLRDYALLHTLCNVAGNKPRVHGNGFIQLDISDALRMNFWSDPRIPRQKTNTPIHDHQFAFTSYVLRGALRNVVYSRTHVELDGQPKPTHRIYSARPRNGEDTGLVSQGDITHLEMERYQTINQGQSYCMLAGEIHESIPMARNTVTIIKKSERATSMPGLVFVPFGVEPDNIFNRETAAPVELLWEIIQDMVS